VIEGNQVLVYLTLITEETEMYYKYCSKTKCTIVNYMHLTVITEETEVFSRQITVAVVMVGLTVVMD
jgi:hypothetical protein